MSGVCSVTEDTMEKPLLRGWLHAGASLAAAVATPRLLDGSGHDPVRFAAMGGFVAAMVLLYGVSALYHIGDWTQPIKRVLAKADYTNIFLFILASYTALSVFVQPDARYLPRLAFMWLLGLAGIACVIAMPIVRRRARTALYVAVGWAGAISVPMLKGVVATPALLMISGSAVAYLIGGAIYALQRPNPLPNVFGFHELFHLFTIVANTALAAAFWIWLLPAGATAL
jgi:hemolysin III